MIKALTLALAISTAAAGFAVAQTAQPSTPPADPAPAATAPSAPAAPADLTAANSPDDCLKSASDLALDAEDKKLAEDKLDKIEDLLIKMETHCDAKQYNEALAVAKDIKAIIETR